MATTIVFHKSSTVTYSSNHTPWQRLHVVDGRGSLYIYISLAGCLFSTNVPLISSLAFCFLWLRSLLLSLLFYGDVWLLCHLLPPFNIGASATRRERELHTIANSVDPCNICCSGRSARGAQPSICRRTSLRVFLVYFIKCPWIEGP